MMVKSKRSNAVLIVLAVVLAALAAAACSSSDSESTGEETSGEADQVGENISEAAEGAGDAVSDAADSVADSVDDAAAQADGSDESSDSLPGWAWALIAAIGVLAVIGVIMGFQNRHSQPSTTGADQNPAQNKAYDDPPQDGTAPEGQ